MHLHCLEFFIPFARTMEADAAAVNGSQKAKFKENEKVFAYHLNLIYEAKVIWQVHAEKYILTSRARS